MARIRNPRFAPEFLEKKLSPSGSIPYAPAQVMPYVAPETTTVSTAYDSTSSCHGVYDSTSMTTSGLTTFDDPEPLPEPYQPGSPPPIPPSFPILPLVPR